MLRAERPPRPLKGEVMTDRTIDHMAINLRSWDERVAIHAGDTTGIYDIDAFLAGADTLMPIEDAEIGDVSGKRIAHLQCHFGIDTVCLTRRGAIATGLDFSSNAIEQARKFADLTQSDTTFVCGNVYESANLLPTGTFDMVYVTWGTIGWLPDLVSWAQNVSALLAPSGTLYLADCHPTMNQLDHEGEKLIFDWPWRSTGASGAQGYDTPVTYAGDGRAMTNAKTYEWVHPISEIISALHGNAMQLDFFHEHETLPWPAVSAMVPAPGRMYRLPDGLIGPPASFSLQARKV